MGETLRPFVSRRDWRVHCYDAMGGLAVCVIDSDHAAVRVGLTVSEEERFFELRAGQVIDFQAAFRATLGALVDCGPDREARWQGSCYSRWGGLKWCLIEAFQHDVVRVSCVTARFSARRWSFELRKDQIQRFQVALAQAMEVFRVDREIYGDHWADEEEDQAAMPSGGMEEADFAEKIYEMVAEDPPEAITLVAEIGDRVDAVKIGHGLKLPDRIEVVSIGPDHVRGSFSSVEKTCKLLSAGGATTIRSVSVAEALQYVKDRLASHSQID